MTHRRTVARAALATTTILAGGLALPAAVNIEIKL